MRSRNVSILRSDVQMEPNLTAAMSLAEEDLDTQVCEECKVDIVLFKILVKIVLSRYKFLGVHVQVSKEKVQTSLPIQVRSIYVGN